MVNNENINKSKNNINRIIEEYIKVPDSYTFKNNNLSNNLKNNFKKPIGLFDPLGNNINPLTGLPYQNLYKNTDSLKYDDGPLRGVKVEMTYRNLAYNWTQLKVYEFLVPILESINNHQVTLIKADTGVGKTVIIPKIALQAFNFQKKVVCTVPKQLNASSNAEYSASCLDVKLGQEVGYYYMGQNKTCDKTMLTFTTPGSLKSKITGSDPYLSEYSCVILDEIHERSVQTDQLILLMKEIMVKRPEFKLILMSATVDLSIFKDYFTKKSDFTYNEVEIKGKTYDVQIFYEPQPLKDWKMEAVNKILSILKTTHEGDILVFIKAGGEGKIICEELSKKTRDLPEINPFCAILEGKTFGDDKKYAIDEFFYMSHPDMDPNNPYTRKIVMSTNVAESSITVKGIIYVIDNGYAMESSYYPKEGARSLIEERISKAAATQRKGRAGRTMNGFCYRLYTEAEYNKFSDFPIPDIQKTDLTSDILDIFSIDYIKNTEDVKLFLQKMISPPSDAFINSAINKLYGLGAITSDTNNGIITDMGRAIGKFRAIECNFAKSILASYYYYCKSEIIYMILIAMQIDGRIDSLFEKYYPRDKRMSNKDIEREKAEHIKKQKSFYSHYGDYFTLLNVYNSLKDFMSKNQNVNPRQWCKINGISSRALINRGYPKKGGWDLIGEKARKVNDTLMKIVRPAELRKKYFNEYKKDGAIENIRTLNNEIKKEQNTIIDLDANELEIIDNMNKNDSILQSAGYKSKLYEVNLFPDAVNTSSKDKNILLALGIGNITNLACIVDEKKGIYKTCFPEKRMYSKFDQNSSLTIKNRTKIVMYNELFMMRRDQPILKLNLITKMPNDIILKIKKDYGQFIKPCFEKNKYMKNQPRKDKFGKKQPRKDKPKKKI
jgi:HrpA-like RNA helicase